MTSTASPRMLHLERLARSGAVLSQSETWELESLRDQAGQGDLFPAVVPELPLNRDFLLIDRDDCRRLAAAPLHGHDGGEQADLFGQTLLL